MIDPDHRFEDWLARHQVEPLPPRPDTYERIARSARRRRAARAVALAATLSVVLAATVGTVYGLSTAPRPVGPPGVTPTATEHTPAPSAPPQQATSSPSAAASTPANNEPTQASRCRTSEVRVTRQTPPAGGAAGNIYDWLVFTNTSSRTCTLYGFPGVSYLTGPTGQQVNQPARRTNVTPKHVALNPQQTAHATVHTAQPGNFPDTCKPVQVAGYRVYLPDETTAVFVPAPSQQCSADGVNVADISPIQPGLTQ